MGNYECDDSSFDNKIRCWEIDVMDPLVVSWVTNLDEHKFLVAFRQINSNSNSTLKMRVGKLLRLMFNKFT